MGGQRSQPTGGVAPRAVDSGPGSSHQVLLVSGRKPCALQHYRFKFFLFVLFVSHISSIFQNIRGSPWSHNWAHSSILLCQARFVPLSFGRAGGSNPHPHPWLSPPLHGCLCLLTRCLRVSLLLRLLPPRFPRRWRTSNALTHRHFCRESSRVRLSFLPPTAQPRQRAETARQRGWTHPPYSPTLV